MEKDQLEKALKIARKRIKELEAKLPGHTGKFPTRLRVVHFRMGPVHPASHAISRNPRLRRTVEQLNDSQMAMSLENQEEDLQAAIEILQKE